MEVGFSSATAGNIDWTGDSEAVFFKEAGTNEVEDTLGAETSGAFGAEATLEGAAVAALAALAGVAAH